MKILRGVALALTLFCGGCTSLGLENQTFLTSKIDSSVSLTMSPQDSATFSKIHDLSLTQCIYKQNKKNNLITIGSITVSNTDLLLAAVAPIAALTKGGSTALIAGISTVVATQLKGIIWPAKEPDYTPIITGMDYVYTTYINSPGIAAMMNDPTPNSPQRAFATKQFETAMEQVCASSMTFPLGSTTVYLPKAGTTPSVSTAK
jgi:hypothetical protein